MENGSGGMMGDLIFNGGKYGTFIHVARTSLTDRIYSGAWVGNQQFTVRNVTFNNAQSAAVYMNWSVIMDLPL
jgi:glucan 1,3-beta-glucosidase